MIDIIINIIMFIIGAVSICVLYNLFLGDIEGRVNKALDEHGLGHKDKKENHMTKDKMNKINDWMKQLDQNTLEMSDQLAISAATLEYISKLEPVYDKYAGNKKETRYR